MLDLEFDAKETILHLHYCDQTYPVKVSYMHMLLSVDNNQIIIYNYKQLPFFCSPVL